MSKDLSPLIRVRKYSVEEKQKALSELYRKAEELEEQKQSLLMTMEEEKQHMAEMDVAMLSYFGPYADAVQERVEDIDEGMKTLNHRIDLAREDVREAFAELKKIEITDEARKDAEAAALAKKDSDELDEIALRQYMYRDD